MNRYIIILLRTYKSHQKEAITICPDEQKVEILEFNFLPIIRRQTGFLSDIGMNILY